MSNSVIVNNNEIVEIKVIGNQTVASVHEMGQTAGTLLQGQTAKKKPALLLDNILEMGDVPSDARKAVIELGKTLPYERCAMVGGNGILRLGANLMLRAVGRGDSIKYFDNRDKATAWLLGKSA